MPYWLRLLTLVLIADAVVLVLAHWLSDLGVVANVAFADVAGSFSVVIGRRVLRRVPYTGCGVFNPDSAIAFDVKSEERTFRSEANGLLPLSER